MSLSSLINLLSRKLKYCSFEEWWIFPFVIDLKPSGVQAVVSKHGHIKD